MDAERTITEIEWLERVYAVPDTRPLNASDIYGASKIAAETVFRAYRRDHGLPAIALRPSSVYGPGRITACFIRDMIDRARRGDPLALAPVGACRRQFVHVDDVVAAIMGALNAPRLDHFAFNVSGGTWLSEQEIVALAAPGLPGLRIVSIDGEMGPLDTARAQAPLVILRPFPSRRASPPTPPPSARARAARLPLASSLLSFVRSFGCVDGPSI